MSERLTRGQRVFAWFDRTSDKFDSDLLGGLWLLLGLWIAAFVSIAEKQDE